MYTVCMHPAVPEFTNSRDLATQSWCRSDDLHLLSTWLVAPTSTSARPATFRPGVAIDGTETRVLAEQASAVDPSRLGGWIGHLGFDELRAVDAALRLVMSL